MLNPIANNRHGDSLRDILAYGSRGAMAGRFFVELTIPGSCVYAIYQEVARTFSTHGFINPIETCVDTVYDLRFFEIVEIAGVKITLTNAMTMGGFLAGTIYGVFKTAFNR